MLYLSGCVHPGLFGRPDVGFMLTPESGYRVPPAPHQWAADAGTFGTPWYWFDADRYLEWLCQPTAEEVSRCLFVTIPDAFGDAARTAELGEVLLPVLAAMGYRCAYVLQPEQQLADIPWPAQIGALFLGGPDPWQQSPAAQGLIREAQARQIWVHRGRVNTRGRQRSTAALGFDSCDGTMVSFGPDDRIPRLRRWLDELAGQQALAL
jgi:hypothetical protein